MTPRSSIVGQLLAKGVRVLAPETVFIDSSVQVDLVDTNVVIHPGCRISGANTCIGPGSVIGEEAPVTLHDCQLESRVSLKGGFFSGATLLDAVSFGSGAHVRPETLMEEGSSCAHTVGLKQTILMPHAVLGSLINFCDCMLSGGTGPKNHSEVGSSYVHFNFTPHQDKATPSLMGDVPRGVMLDQPPIFLGGQGGLIGPSRIAFGSVIAAGTILRKDITEPNQLVYGHSGGTFRQLPYETGRFGNLDRIIANNFNYIKSLHALAEWYGVVRPFQLTGTPIREQCLKSAQDRIQRMIAERVKRLDELALKVKDALDGSNGNAHVSHTRLIESWPAWKASISSPPPAHHQSRDSFIELLQKSDFGNGYVNVIQGLQPEAKAAGTAWLQSMFDGDFRVGPNLFNPEGN
jgi:hypothetical protein